MSIREIKRTALVTFTPEQMFDLVVDVERYPQFLPWVAAAELHARNDRELMASMTMERAGVKQRFTTRNALERPEWMTMQLVEGPFRLLEGLWTFTPIGAAGTRVVLEMKFAFSNPVSSMLFGRSFEHSVGQLIDAFVQRAKQMYGNGGD
jgi:ribosome-associated toxin RatA of RatAB toxin-antitoxin module